MASRHPQFSSFGLVVGGAGPVNEYGGTREVFDSPAHRGQGIPPGGVGTVLPRTVSAQSSHQSSPVSSVATVDNIGGYAPPPYPTRIPISQSADSPHDYTSGDYTSGASSPSPSGSLRPPRPHFQYYLERNEPPRQMEHFLGLQSTAHTEIPRRMIPSASHPLLYTPRSTPVAENYDSLFDMRTPDQVIMKQNQEQDSTMGYLDTREVNYYGETGSGYDVPKNQTKMIVGPNKEYHPLGLSMLDNVLMLAEVMPQGSLDSIHDYLDLYWTQFHPTYPLLHRPTFVPSLQAQGNNLLLVSIMLAIGASFSPLEEGREFGQRLYEKVRGCVINVWDAPHVQWIFVAD